MQRSQRGQFLSSGQEPLPDIKAIPPLSDATVCYRVAVPIRATTLVVEAVGRDRPTRSDAVTTMMVIIEQPVWLGHQAFV
jgi:hypothetical protein